MRRMYHIVAINERTRNKEYMTGYAMPHDQACVMLKKISAHPARRVQLEEVEPGDFKLIPRGDSVSYRNWTSHGYVWAYDEDGAHYFQRDLGSPIKDRYALMKLLPEDMTAHNFEFMCRLGLSRE